MNEFDRMTLQIHLCNAMNCIEDGKRGLAARNLEHAVRILDGSVENEKVNESGIN